ncbi:hypothetical protein TNCV_504841 [Trichonephila clavipes]|nr:hypothetical protein TNCV_504841 [Trichonephila clavipes]
MDTSPVAPLRKRGRPRKVTSTSIQNTHVPSPSTASTAISSRTIHPSTKATTTTANSSDSVSSPGRRRIHRGRFQMNSLAASVKLTYSASMVDRLTDFCLKVRHEIGVSSIKVMNPPIDTRSSLFVAKAESE